MFLFEYKNVFVHITPTEPASRPLILFPAHTEQMISHPPKKRPRHAIPTTKIYIPTPAPTTPLPTAPGLHLPSPLSSRAACSLSFPPSPRGMPFPSAPMAFCSRSRLASAFSCACLSQGVKSSGASGHTKGAEAGISTVMRFVARGRKKLYFRVYCVSLEGLPAGEGGKGRRGEREGGGGKDGPSPRDLGARFPSHDARLLYVRAHAQRFHAVAVVQVVLDVELVEVQRGQESGVGGRREGGAEEGECEIWSVSRLGMFGEGGKEGEE